MTIVFDTKCGQHVCTRPWRDDGRYYVLKFSIISQNSARFGQCIAATPWRRAARTGKRTELCSRYPRFALFVHPSKSPIALGQITFVWNSDSVGWLYNWRQWLSTHKDCMSRQYVSTYYRGPPSTSSVCYNINSRKDSELRNSQHVDPTFPEEAPHVFSKAIFAALLSFNCLGMNGVNMNIRGSPSASAALHISSNLLIKTPTNDSVSTRIPAMIVFQAS